MRRRPGGRYLAAATAERGIVPCETWRTPHGYRQRPDHGSTAADPRTLRRRRSIPLQMWRFGQINLRMLRMVRKAH